MKRLLNVTLLVIMMLMLFATPVLADQADPDSTPTVEQIDVYRNLLETDDRLFLIYANTPYATIPDISFPNAFVWRLLDTDNITELGSTTGFAYNDDGYGYNVFGLYFTAADNVTWGQAYNLRLSGNPSAFDSPKQYNYPLNVADYTTLTTGANNRAALAARILTLATELDNRWGLSATNSLIISTESGTALSIFGEAFFRGAIFGIQALAPAAFRMLVQDIDALDRTWDTTFSANLTGQYAGTWIEPAKTGGGTLFGVGYDLTSIIIFGVLCALLVYGNLQLSRGDTWNGLIDIAILLVIAPRIDMIPLSFTALICAIFILYEGTKVKAFVR